MKKFLTIIVLGLLSGAGIAMSWIAPFYLVWSIVFTVCLAISFIFLLVTEILNQNWRKLAIACL